MGRVVLFYPFTGLDLKGLSVWLPLSLLQTAATLTADFDVEIIDQRVHDDWRERLRRTLDDDTLCVGISSMTGTQIKGGLLAARVVREAAPEVPIVWGGNHPTLVPETTARHPCVDIVVMGEGEVTFRNLVRRLAEGRSFEDLRNIAWVEKDGTFRKNGTGTHPEDFVDQDEMPPLPYHLLEIDHYISGPVIFGKGVRSLPYISSQGCPYPCTFCCQPVLSSRRWRRQSPEMVVERVMDLKEKYGLNAIEFHDEEFFVDRKRGQKIGEMINGEFQWYVQTRMDDLLKLDLDALERQGLRVVQPGLETGSPRILKMIRKGETLEDFHKANRKLASTGIRSTYNFMMGYPTETHEDLVATVELALKLLDENPKASISGFYVYVPYPGAELFEMAVRDGFEPPETLEGWAVFNRQHLASPWIQDRRDVLEMLLYTSKFVDGRRLKQTFTGRPLLLPFIGAVSRFYRRRWRKHNFEKTLDIDLLALAARHVFGW